MAERVTRLETRMDGHEALCGERWTQLRGAVETSRVERTGQIDGLRRNLRRVEFTYYAGVITVLALLVKMFWLDKL